MAATLLTTNTSTTVTIGANMFKVDATILSKLDYFKSRADGIIQLPTDRTSFHYLVEHLKGNLIPRDNALLSCDVLLLHSLATLVQCNTLLEDIYKIWLPKCIPELYNTYELQQFLVYCATKQLPRHHPLLPALFKCKPLLLERIARFPSTILEDILNYSKYHDRILAIEVGIILGYAIPTTEIKYAIWEGLHPLETHTTNVKLLESIVEVETSNLHLRPLHHRIHSIVGLNPTYITCENNNVYYEGAVLFLHIPDAKLISAFSNNFRWYIIDISTMAIIGCLKTVCTTLKKYIPHINKVHAEYDKILVEVPHHTLPSTPVYVKDILVTIHINVDSTMQLVVEQLYII